jgi:hypothetical protein
LRLALLAVEPKAQALKDGLLRKPKHSAAVAGLIGDQGSIVCTASPSFREVVGVEDRPSEDRFGVDESAAVHCECERIRKAIESLVRKKSCARIGCDGPLESVKSMLSSPPRKVEPSHERIRARLGDRCVGFPVTKALGRLFEAPSLLERTRLGED